MATTNVKAYAAGAPDAPLAEMNIERRDVLAKDIEIEIMYCGVCHSDLHFAKNDWGMTTYPVVPGHEIVGKVTRVGSGVTKLKVGDFAAVGCLVDSCRTCSSCEKDLYENQINSNAYSIKYKIEKINYDEFKKNINAFTELEKAFKQKNRIIRVSIFFILTYLIEVKWSINRKSFS